MLTQNFEQSPSTSSGRTNTKHLTSPLSPHSTTIVYNCANTFRIEIHQGNNYGLINRTRRTTKRRKINHF